jgi:hypothetical protein
MKRIRNHTLVDLIALASSLALVIAAVAFGAMRG